MLSRGPELLPVRRFPVGHVHVEDVVDVPPRAIPPITGRYDVTVQKYELRLNELVHAEEAEVILHGEDARLAEQDEVHDVGHHEAVAVVSGARDEAVGQASQRTRR